MKNEGPIAVSQTPDTKAMISERRKAALSPELRELMHMLTSLEKELAERQPASR